MTENLNFICTFVKIKKNLYLENYNTSHFIGHSVSGIPKGVR